MENALIFKIILPTNSNVCTSVLFLAFSRRSDRRTGQRKVNRKNNEGGGVRI